MSIISKLKYMIKGAERYSHIDDVLQSVEFRNEIKYGELLRNVHSIEKGLSLEHIRKEFGYAKIMDAITIVYELMPYNESTYNEAIDMFISALKSYLEYHESIGYTSDKISEIRMMYEELKNKRMSTNKIIKTGGTLHIQHVEYTPEEKAVMTHLFESRHSVRAFSGLTVPDERIKDAFRLAHRCPSACNRQGYRAHIIPKDKFNVFNNWFEGVGGFKQDIDKIILITGKQSVYRSSEELQYIVSASVFAGYLTLALQVYDIGCCFIQRPLIYTKEWMTISEKLSIPRDEQIICALGVGMLKSEYNVPVSHRIDIDTIARFH